MIASQKQARDDIFTLLQTTWDAESASMGLPLLFQDVSKDKPDSGSWARATVSHATGRQAALTEASKKHTHAGFVTVQIFTDVGGGLDAADDLSEVVHKAFEGKATTNGVWFRNVRTNEVGPDSAGGPWFQTNVIADFTYDMTR